MRQIAEHRWDARKLHKLKLFNNDDWYGVQGRLWNVSVADDGGFVWKANL